jgi:hypothetical protein
MYIKSNHHFYFLYWLGIFFLICLFMSPIGLFISCAPNSKINVTLLPSYKHTFSNAQSIKFEATGDFSDSPIYSERIDISKKYTSLNSFMIDTKAQNQFIELRAFVLDEQNKQIGFGQTLLPFVSREISRTLLLTPTNNFGWLTKLEGGSQAYLPQGLIGHRAVALSNGEILIVGGAKNISGYRGIYTVAQSSDMQANLLLYNPQSGEIEDLRISLGNPRLFHSATLLKDGRVLIAGGLGFISGGLSPLKTVELYHPTSRSLTNLAPIQEARAFHSATLIEDNEVLIIGGFSQTLNLKPKDPTEWVGHLVTAIESYNLGDSSKPQQVGTLRAFVDEYDCLCAGSNANCGKVDSRFLHQAVRLTADLVLISGGLQFDTNGERVTPDYNYILRRSGGNCWRPEKIKKTVSQRYEHTASIIQDNQNTWAIILGGRDASDNLASSIEIWDSGGNLISTDNRLSPLRYGHAAMALPNHQLLVVGGLDAEHKANQGATLYQFSSSGGLANIEPLSLPNEPKLLEQRGRFMPILASSTADQRVLIFGGSSVEGDPKAKDPILEFTGLRSVEIYTPLQTERDKNN